MRNAGRPAEAFYGSYGSGLFLLITPNPVSYPNPNLSDDGFSDFSYEKKHTASQKPDYVGAELSQNIASRGGDLSSAYAQDRLERIVFQVRISPSVALRGADGKFMQMSCDVRQED